MTRAGCGAVLLISDDPGASDRIRAALETRGFALRHEREPEALSSAAEGTYRFVLLDASTIGLEVLNGVRRRHEILEVGRVRLVPTARLVQVGGAEVTLTAMEYDVLECLARAAGRVVPRDELMAAVWRRPASPLDRALDVHVSHLRRKLGDEGRQILTVRGVGYMLAIPRGERGMPAQL
jgi:DNA-binding response OmpR family regulator